MPKFKIDIQGLDKLNKAFQVSPRIVVAQLTQAIKTSINIIRPIMVRNAPVKTSKLRQNISAISSGLSGQVGPNLSVTPYAWFVHFGTRPYTIFPKTKKALYWKGALHPVRKVNHPGIRANPFVERTANEMRSPVIQIFNKTLENIAKELSK